MVDVAQISTDEKIAQAQQLLSIATRNYYVKAYSDAVDDFSTVCQIFSEVYGPSAEQLGKPYLLYAKCLIALGQEENKLMEIPEEQEDEEEEGDDEDASAEDHGLNGNCSGAVAPSSNLNGVFPEPAQPGTSTGITQSEVDVVVAVDEEEEDDDVANLQVAWEVLELAVSIFSNHPEQAKELAESYIELAGISFENSNFEAAIKDFKQALGVLQDLPDKDHREFAEINYKIGLSYSMLNLFEEATTALTQACSYLDEVIRIELARESSNEVLDAIKDLRETKVEIENKIAEVEDYKQQSMDTVKQELAKLVGHHDSFDKAAGEGTSSRKPAADISHLIKRKKPEEIAGESPGPESSNDVTHLVKRKKEE